jgi:hydroxymethylpyrimidine pyrophosphatase-like HAD family hydrolase
VRERKQNSCFRARASAQADLTKDALAGEQLSGEADREAKHGQAAIPGFSEIHKTETSRCRVGIRHRNDANRRTVTKHVGCLTVFGDTVAATSSPYVVSRQILQSQLSAPLPEAPELVLVTDLDGTLLEGATDERRRFYRWLVEQRDRVLHVFCTGRDLTSIARVLAEDEPIGLAAPHLVIGDVGCTVACGQSLLPVPLAVDPIEALWQGKEQLLLPLLQGQPGLAPQPLHSDRRLAYYVDPEAFDHSLIPQLEAHGVDCLLSDNRYLDLLPTGVNKGSTLLALLAWLDVDPACVVTAGDTLNDLAMFETGLKGVMVANAEAALLDHLPRLPSVYLASEQGCAGIAEGLRHFGFDHLWD